MHIERNTHIKEETIKNSRSSSSEDQQHDNIALGRLKCTFRPPLRYDFKDLVSYALITYNSDHTTFQEALDSQDKSKWISSMKEEMESLYKNQT
jgi:hypothetical protein